MRATKDSTMKVKPEVRVEKPNQGADVHILMEAVLETIVRSPDGKVSHHDIRKSESFVRQWIELLWLSASGVNVSHGGWGYPMRDTGNTLRQMIRHANNWFLAALATITTHGILVGLGNTAPTIDDYAMETLVVHGTGADQLQYSAMAVGFPGVNANISQITITRNFSNAMAAPGDVTVFEVGTGIRAVDTGATSRFFLILRDVIPLGIVVPHGDTLTVNYRLQCEL